MIMVGIITIIHIRSDLVGETGVRTVGMVPQLGILGVVTPGVTSSAMMIIIVLLNNQ